MKLFFADKDTLECAKGKKMLYLSHFTFSVNIFADSHARDTLKYVWMQNTFGVKLPELLYSLQKNRIRKQKNMYMYFVPKETLNVRFGAYEKWQAALVKNTAKGRKEKKKTCFYFISTCFVLCFVSFSLDISAYKNRYFLKICRPFLQELLFGNGGIADLQYADL